jgi:hypothetical protein
VFDETIKINFGEQLENALRKVCFFHTCREIALGRRERPTRVGGGGGVDHMKANLVTSGSGQHNLEGLT